VSSQWLAQRRASISHAFTSLKKYTTWSLLQVKGSHKKMWGISASQGFFPALGLYCPSYKSFLTSRQRKALRKTDLQQLSKGVHMTHPQPEGFLAIPPGGEGPGVLVLHAWWGLNETLKTFCTRLAEAGFMAFAPDLYHGKVADTIPGAEALGAELDANHLQAKSKIAAATLFLHERTGKSEDGLAVIGFSLGAYYALDLAAADPEHIRSVVLFYGTGGGDFNNSRAAYLGHFAGNDPYEPPTNVDELEASLQSAGRPVTFHRYPGTVHWFFEPDRTDAYNPEAAGLAWERTLSFLKDSLSPDAK